MALINRISRLFKADFHAILDQIEEPGPLLKQAIRDMEDDLAATQRRIKLCTHEQDQLSARKRELESRISGVDEQLDLCFESDKDDLARSLIRKKLEARQLLKRLGSRYAENAKYLDSQQAMWNENRATLESLRQKAELFAQRTPTPDRDEPDFGDLAWTVKELSVGDDEVEIAYLHEKSVRSTS